MRNKNSIGCNGMLVFIVAIIVFVAVFSWLIAVNAGILAHGWPPQLR